MPAVQLRLLHALAPVRVRRARRPFHPLGEGPYRLPNAVRDRLTAALTPYRNREAVFTLAVFLGRFWSSPRRMLDAFPIDRRALADHPGLGLTEAQVRGAIRTLEEVGFLDRAIPANGSRYKATEDGLHRKPILFTFGADYGAEFIKANKRAAAARGDHSPDRRRIDSAYAQRPPVINFKSPKSRNPSERPVIMGEVMKRSGIPPLAFESNPQLGSALERLLLGIRLAEGQGRTA